MIAHGARKALLCCIPLAVLTTVSGQEKPSEPPAPPATVAVQQLLGQAIASANRGAASEALEIAERAIAAAREAADSPGEARAHRLIAQQLQNAASVSKAALAWGEAEAAWKRAGDGPGQVQAVGWQAILAMPQDPLHGAQLLRRTTALAESEANRPRMAATALCELGDALAGRSLLSEAQQVYETALRIAEKAAPGQLETASGFSGLGVVAQARGILADARQYYEQALSIRQKVAPNSLPLASSLNNLGNLAAREGNLEAAGDFFVRALRIHESVAPGTLFVSGLLNNLGLVAFYAGDLAAARDYHQRSFAIRETLAPNSLDQAASLTNLGNVSHEEGDLAAARDCFRRAMAIYGRMAPGSMPLAVNLSNLGVVAWAQGDLSVARDYFNQSLAIREKLAPDSLDVAESLHSIGNLTLSQGDPLGAQDYFQRSLAIFERLAPNSLGVAELFNSLGAVAFDQGDLKLARTFHQRALGIREKLAADSLAVAMSLNNLGAVAHHSNDVIMARANYQRSLALSEKLAPSSLNVAAALGNLGDLERGLGNLAAAHEHHQRALMIRQRLAPTSLDLADSLNQLGRIAFDRGDVASAAEYSARAWAIVRTQAAGIAGDEARQSFESSFLHIGTQLVRSQIGLGKTDDAFLTLEEGRAQALLHMLSQRGVARRLAPTDIWRRYEIAQTASNRAGSALEEAGQDEATARLALEAALKSARDVVPEKRRVVAEREQNTEQARQAYTRLRIEAEQRWAEVVRSLQSAAPSPLPPMEARRALPPDTVLAAFTVGEDAMTLFVAQRDTPVRGYPINVSLKELTARVTLVRESASRMERARAVVGVDSEEARIAAARSLYRQLFPDDARALIARSKRVLLSPDGVLWDLPFAALVVNDQGEPHYLGLETPLLYTQSLTAFAQMRQMPSSGAVIPRNVIVIGNPLYDNALRGDKSSARSASSGDNRASGELRLLSHDSRIPASLPHAEQEAHQVAALYGARASTAAEPTESWFRQRAGDASVIHLATHGYFNAFRAVGSGVRLAVPERQTPGDTDNDGALQAWEVFTQLRLRADLVVLSACLTGIGAKVPGEGLVGLTRAFQVAGATSIVATQWSVADRSTASGMVAFHQHLRKGVPKDEALRLSMRQLASDPATSHPYYWAPFMLVGDFRPLGVSSDNH